MNFLTLRDPRSLDLGPIAVAERICGTADLRSDGSVSIISWCLANGTLRHVLQSYLNYYNETRTHLSLDKDAPIPRTVEAVGRICIKPVLGGLHHQYARL